MMPQLQRRREAAGVIHQLRWQQKESVGASNFEEPVEVKHMEQKHIDERAERSARAKEVRTQCHGSQRLQQGEYVRTDLRRLSVMTIPWCAVG
jgi:hypothetical protein